VRVVFVPLECLRLLSQPSSQASLMREGTGLPQRKLVPQDLIAVGEALKFFAGPTPKATNGRGNRLRAVAEEPSRRHREGLGGQSRMQAESLSMPRRPEKDATCATSATHRDTHLPAMPFVGLWQLISRRGDPELNNLRQAAQMHR
jgi:hypothetical protein